jgi:hypothetical protein
LCRIRGVGGSDFFLFVFIVFLHRAAGGHYTKLEEVPCGRSRFQGEAVMRRCSILLRSAVLLLVVSTVACGPAAPPKPAAEPSMAAQGQGRCGDGRCESPESSSNCPSDCAETGPSAGSSGTVLYYGVMVHLEGWNDRENRMQFTRHAELVRRYAYLFERYGAKLTLESKEFTDGCIAWGDNALKEMEDRGHGIGVHADIGGERDMRCEEFAPLLRERKQTLESLGVRVRHVSGIVSTCDWVTAAADAGFLFTTGTVAYALMSLPVELRPTGFTDCLSPSKCHQSYPFDLEGQMHPWRMSSGKDWIYHSADGPLVILPSGGGLPCAAEEAGWTGSYTKCEFAAQDIDAIVASLEQALALVDASKVNIYYLSWSIGQELDESLLENFLQRLKPFVDDGRVQWKTLPEMYDLYIAWEAAQAG